MNNLGTLSPGSEPPGGSGMANATALPEPPSRLQEVTALRNKLLQLVGAGHGEEIMRIQSELMRLHPRPSRQDAPEQRGDAEAVVRKFLRRTSPVASKEGQS
jgi:hypothetical protein